jgi:hypothetical protein
MTNTDLCIAAIIGAFMFGLMGFLAYGVVMYEPIEMDYMGDPALYEFIKNGG